MICQTALYFIGEIVSYIHVFRDISFLPSGEGGLEQEYLPG